MKRDDLLKRVTDSISKVTAGGGKVAEYYEIASAELTRIEDKGNVALLLDNLQRISDADEGQAFITTSNYGPYVQEFWPIVTAWYPEFPLKDLICVQTMDRPLAYLFFSRLLVGTNKADSIAGEVVETATGKRVLRGRYPTGEIFGEALVTADFIFDDGTDQSIAVLAYYPLVVTGDNIEKYLLTVDSTLPALDGVLSVLNVTGDLINFKKGAGTDILATIDMKTGQLVINEGISGPVAAGSITSVSVNYVWNIESAVETTIPSITEDVEKISMEAIPRALGIKWSIFSEYVKKKQFGQDIRVDTTKRVLEIIFQYQCRYILDQMYDYAGGFVDGSAGEVIDISLVPTTAVTIETRVQEVLLQLNAVGNAIEMNVGRMAGNRIVAGMALKSWLESLPNTYFKPVTADQGYNSPRKIGTIGRYEVYYDPQRASDEGFMTYRGTEWYDATYYVGEFMPIVPTDAIALGVTVRSSMVSMEAYKYHKKGGVTKLSFVTA